MNFFNIDTYCYLVIWFSFYSFLGWLYESAWVSINHKEFINRGFLTGPVIPIYGFGAVLFIILLHSFENPVVIFILGSVTACILEYFTSWSMEKIFHARWWDYSHYPFNLNGRICLYGATLFGVFAVIIIKVLQPVLEKYTNYPPYILYSLTVLLLLLFIYDTVTTVKRALHLSEKMAAVQKAINDYKNMRLKLYKEKSMEYLGDIREDFEKSEIYAKLKESIGELTSHERRLIKAFPTIKSKEFADGLERIKNHINLKLKRDK